MNTPIAENSVSFSGDSASSASTSSAAMAATGEVCTDGAIATALGAIRCAAKSDPALPAYAKSEQFLRDLQKATGKSPDVFFANFESPAKSIVDSPAVAALPESAQRDLADSLSAMEGYSEMKASKLANSKSDSNGGYTGGGSSNSVSDNETGFDVNGILANVLGQMGGAEDGTGAEKSAGHSPLDRNPASDSHAAENRKVSIFDRVQWRYGAVSVRDQLGVQ